MPQFRYLFLSVPILAFFLTFPGKAALQTGGCDAFQGISWRERNTKSFIILYPEQYEAIAHTLTDGYRAGALDLEYTRFEALFETSLTLPISIRIYPDHQSYSCLNSISNIIPPGSTHTHSGTREIALIGDNIIANFPAWIQFETNLIRYELGVLFARQTAGDRIPSGLEAAVGQYVQDPVLTIGTLRLNRSDWLAPAQDLYSLWENAPTHPDLENQIHATSTIAFLVDQYGWGSFLGFLQSISSSQSFSQAVTQAYGSDLATLEKEWRAYLPRYIQGRWQSHEIYNYDLEPYQQMISEGEYIEADRLLREAISFLEKIHHPEKLGRALALIEMARSGQEAENLLAQAQQALQAGDYQGSLALLDQAEEKYILSGNRLAHLDELSAYRQQINQVTALHGELAGIQERITNQWNTLSLAAQLISLGRNFSTLGDSNGHSQVLEMAEIVEARQKEQYLLFAAAIFTIVLALLIYRFHLVRYKQPPEANL